MTKFSPLPICTFTVAANTMAANSPAAVLSVAADPEAGPSLPGAAHPQVRDIRDLNVEEIRALAPRRVVAWLYCQAYDVFDVARRLVDAGFRGVFTIVSWPIPRPAIVRAELRRAFPGLRVDIVQHNDPDAGNSGYEAALRAASSA